tara:strand:+ start:713 stop:1009 length:297 start_codon:yes stop_codon:yes gene_type:complete
MQRDGSLILRSRIDDIFEFSFIFPEGLQTHLYTFNSFQFFKISSINTLFLQISIDDTIKKSARFYGFLFFLLFMGFHSGTYELTMICPAFTSWEKYPE